MSNLDSDEPEYAYHVHAVTNELPTLTKMRIVRDAYRRVDTEPCAICERSRFPLDDVNRTPRRAWERFLEDSETKLRHHEESLGFFRHYVLCARVAITLLDVGLWAALAGAVACAFLNWDDNTVQSVRELWRGVLHHSRWSVEL